MSLLDLLKKGLHDVGGAANTVVRAATPLPAAHPARPTVQQAPKPVVQTPGPAINVQPIQQPHINPIAQLHIQQPQIPKINVAAPVQQPILNKPIVAKPQQLNVGNKVIPVGNGAVTNKHFTPTLNNSEKFLASKPGTVGLGAARSLAGTGQAVSGLVDLASPGLGTNRFSKAAGVAAQRIDQAAVNSSKPLYRSAQLGTDLGTFALGGELVGTAKAIPGATKLAEVAGRPTAALADKLAQGGFKSRVAANTIKGATNGKLLAGNVGTQAFYTGQNASRGQNINPLEQAGQFAAGQVGLPLAAGLAKESLAPATQAAMQALRDSHVIRPSRLNDNEVADLHRFNQSRGSYDMQDGNTYEAGLAAARKAGIDHNNPQAIDDLVNAHLNHATQVQNRQAALQALGQRMQLQNEGGYIAGPKAIGFKGAKDNGRVFEGVDGKPRFEVSDESAKLHTDKLNPSNTLLNLQSSHGMMLQMKKLGINNPEIDARLKAIPEEIKQAQLAAKNSKNFKVSDILEHDQMFAQYPELRDVNVKVVANRGHDTLAAYDSRTNTIELNKNRLDTDPDKVKGTILHELQHAIQDKEGFAQGSYAKNMDEYHRSAGEAEARAVQKRMNMKGSERYVKDENTLYHGGNHTLDQFDVNKAHPSGLYGKALYLTKDANRAKSYGDNVSEHQLPKDAKLITSKEFEKRVSEVTPTVQYGDPTIARAKAIEQLRKEGYVGVREVNKQNGDTVAVFDPSVLKKATPRSTFYDSLDVPKDQLIVKTGDSGVVNGKAMSIDKPNTAADVPTNRTETALPKAQKPTTVPLSRDNPVASLGKDTPELPVHGTKQVKMRDKAFRSTRSIIERQGEHGKTLANLLQKSRDDEEIYQGALQKQLPTVRSLKGDDFENFVEATQGKAKANSPKIEQAIKEWQTVHPTIRDRAVKAGLDVGDLGPNYYPHFIDYDKVFKDKNTYNQAINHLVETGQAPSQEEAIKLLNYAKDVSRNRKFGNLEAERTIDLPMYDKTPNSLISYIQGSTHRIAQTENLGAKDEHALKLITKAGQQGYDTQAMKEAYDVASGAKRYGETATKVSNKLRSYQSTTRLGLGALTNASQNVNTGIVTGHLRTLGAMVKQLSPEVRSRVQDTGVIADAVLNDLKTQSGFVGKSLSKITAPGFGAVEKFNRSVAATAGRDYGLRLAQKGDEKTLRRLGVTGEITGKTLTTAQQVQIARKVVEKTQFKVDPQDLPGWADSPGGKLVSQFRTFSYAQGKFFSNEIIKPLASGNIKPAARLLAALPVGYALYETKRAIAGRPEEPSQSRRGIEAFGNVGGAGLAVDIFRGLVPLNGKYLTPDRFTSMAAGTLGGPTLGAAVDAAGAGVQTVQKKNLPASKDDLKGKAAIVKKDGYYDATTAARFGLRQIPIVGTAIQNRVLPYQPKTGLTKDQQSAANAMTDPAKKADFTKTMIASNEAEKNLARKQKNAAFSGDTSGLNPVDKLKATEKSQSAALKSSLSPEDYKLAHLSKKDRQKLIDNKSYTQAKFDGLDNYIYNEKKKLGIDTGTSKTAKINVNTPADQKKFLTAYDNMSAAERKDATNTQNDFEYKALVAKYANNNTGKTLSTVQDINAKEAIDKALVGKDYPKEVRDLHGLTKDELSDYLAKSEPGKDKQKLAGQIIAYDDALTAKHIQAKNKFRLKDGSVAITPGGSSKKKAKSTKASKTVVNSSISYSGTSSSGKLPGGTKQRKFAQPRGHVALKSITAGNKSSKGKNTKRVFA